MALTKLLDSYLLNEEKRRSKRIRSGLYSPSSFGLCYRKQYYNRLDEPKSNPSDLKGIKRMKAGSVFHTFLQSLISSQTMCVIEGGYENKDCAFFVDVELVDRIIEIKTITSYACRMMKKKDYDVRRDKAHSILQAAYYAVMRKKETFELAFYCMDNGECIEFEFKTVDFIGLVQEEVQVLRNWWAKGKLPPPVARVKWDCGYCSWKDTCEESKNEMSISSK